MNYQVSTVEYTTPASKEYTIPKDCSSPEEKHTATVIKVVGNINLDNIMLPRTYGYVYVENNKNEWIFMQNIPQDNNAYCIDNAMYIYWYQYDGSETPEDYDEQSYLGAARHLRQLHYLKSQLN